MTHLTTLARTQHLKRTTDKGRRAHQPQRENTYYCTNKKRKSRACRLGVQAHQAERAGVPRQPINVGLQLKTAEHEADSLSRAPPTWSALQLLF